MATSGKWTPTHTGKNDFAKWLATYKFPVSKDEERRKRFAAISYTNTEIASELLAEVTRLSEEGDSRRAKKLLAIIHKLLDNNANFQDFMGEILSEKR